MIGVLATISSAAAALLLSMQLTIGPSTDASAVADACFLCEAMRDGLNSLLNGVGAVAAGALAAGTALGSGALGVGGAMGGSALGAGRAGAQAARTATDAATQAAADAFGLNDPPAYTPGASPLPQPGETYAFPGMGPATVKSVVHKAGSTSFGGGPAYGSTTIVTDRGTVKYGNVGTAQYGEVRWNPGVANR